ncbi:DUF6193 family natural product biosynthesis protein [Streptomyces sp. NPDC012935]|uniref:DUF6193 family natural product biosynthesis protein n=1 Tax=Streptomyces sp. NPDC012935 TaxID=3364857 RepID=UPI00368A1737
MDSLDSDLNPDVLEAGSLISLMELAAVKKSLDLGRVYSHHASGPDLLTSAELDSSRGRISIQLDSQSRAFFVAIQGQGFTWADGATDDLDDLIDAVASWRDGISVDDFAGKFPFMAPGRQARARESGDPTLAQWNWLRTAEEFSEERPLVEEAYSYGRFGGFFPTLSHGTLRLRSRRRFQGGGEARLTPLSGGLYRVENALFHDQKVVDSLREALSVASESLAGDD